AAQTTVPNEAGAGDQPVDRGGDEVAPVVRQRQDARAENAAERGPDHDRRHVPAVEAAALEPAFHHRARGQERERHQRAEAVEADRPQLDENRDHGAPTTYRIESRGATRRDAGDIGAPRRAGYMAFMPRAGFWAIESRAIRFGKDGRWYSD